MTAFFSAIDSELLSASMAYNFNTRLLDALLNAIGFKVPVHMFVVSFVRIPVY